MGVNIDRTAVHMQSSTLRGSTQTAEGDEEQAERAAKQHLHLPLWLAGGEDNTDILLVKIPPGKKKVSNQLYIKLKINAKHTRYAYDIKKKKIHSMTETFRD